MIKDMAWAMSYAIKKASRIERDGEQEAKSAATPLLAKLIRREASKKAFAIIGTSKWRIAKTLEAGGSKEKAKENAIASIAAMNPYKDKKVPDINTAAMRLSGQLMRRLNPEYAIAKKMNAFIDNKQNLSDTSIENLDRALEIVIGYAQDYRAKIAR